MELEATVPFQNDCRKLLVQLKRHLAGFERVPEGLKLNDLSSELARHEEWLEDATPSVVLEAARNIDSILISVLPMDMEDDSPLSFSPESTQAENENYSVVRVFYATDRSAEPTSDGKLDYGGGRSPGGDLNYGECLISIPKVRKLGELSSPSIWRLEFRPDPNKHIVLLETLSKEESEYLKLVREAVEKSPAREAFVFIHGYNVAFVDAARRTGQMAYDLKFQGAPIFYSWPSNAKTKDYTRDEADVAWSAPHLERFLNLLGSQSGAAKIHIIAHSMGNRAACEALKGISRNPIPGLEFRHVILAAPDIDADTFAELASALKAISHRLTLYASSNDKALWASKTLHGNPRAGQAGDRIVVVAGVDTIDASAISTDFLAHSYFSDSWPLLGDIQAMLSDDKPPGSRLGLVEVKKTNGTYFAFQAN